MEKGIDATPILTTFLGLPHGLLMEKGIDVTPILTTFLGLPLGLDTLAFVDICGTLGSFGGQPLGLGGDKPVLEGNETLGLGALSLVKHLC